VDGTSFLVNRTSSLQDVVNRCNIRLAAIAATATRPNLSNALGIQPSATRFANSYRVNRMVIKAFHLNRRPNGTGQAKLRKAEKAIKSGAADLGETA
jgi:hypothetical protein